MNTPISPQQCGLPHAVWLASRSPRRLELLQTLGLNVTVFLAQNSPEAEALEAPFEQEDPLVYVQRVTQLKLNAALNAMREKSTEQGLSGLVLAADTTVALNGNILGKPQNAAEAFQMLHSLSGTTHQVHTAVAGAWLDEKGTTQAIRSIVQTSQVEFATLPETFIQAYIASGEPFDKAGAYGIQGIAGQYVRHISGSHSGIMGLPLFETSELMRLIQTAAQSSH
ncbi:septum formation protein [Limnobacter thiooxidans]|uniref:dTTP/UTP pyrophosphatase n=1 Tax=Limnobacter thiooxidans TaxID=131080 RepID=A0AA86JHC9_9BURK|nr:septum formation protein [Limnobacter thiooxidans]BET27141.1 Maf family protein [Limnobacter thiooxidans]